MSATFERYEDSAMSKTSRADGRAVDKAGQYRWRLVHANGNIIADSGEGYATRQKVRQGIENVKQNAPDAPVETVDE